MTRSQALAKRAFDILFATVVLVLTSPLIVLGVGVAMIENRGAGVFTQHRVGRNGRLFRIVKIRTMHPGPGLQTNVTARSDPRITIAGRVMRRTKIDELLQFINVLLGHMSVVGPRPDVPGFADLLEGSDRDILALRPGITGPASIYWRDEENILSSANDPEAFNRAIVWPTKVRMNLEYSRNYSLAEDVRLIADTAFPFLGCSQAARLRRNRAGAAVVTAGDENRHAYKNPTA